MRYIDFQETMKGFPVFSVREIQKHFPGFDSRRLTEWQEKGYIQKLRNKYYCFSDALSTEQGLFYTANKIYHPSYISLESALAWHGIIPESAFQVISCTTRKTQSFETPRGTFWYRHIKSPLYFGYRLQSWDGHHYLIAGTEKALIDYLYLHPEIQDTDAFEALRWNPLSISEQISPEKLDRYVSYIDSPALSSRISLLKDFLYATAQ